MDPTDRRKRASEDAADWFVRLQAQDLPRASREQYVDWLRDSATHVAEMIRVAQVHGALEQFEGWARIKTDGPREDGDVVHLGITPLSAGKTTERAGRSRSRFWRLAIAATIGVVVLSVAILVSRDPSQVIRTERGERREVVLNDGSIVQVDPQTHLRVMLERDFRHVYLENGRALFHVAKNPKRPFIVHAYGTTVRAVGTAFSVERQKKGVVVTVSEGNVAVATPKPLGKRTGAFARSPGTEQRPPAWDGGIPAVSSAKPRMNADEVYLSADEQLVVQRSGPAEPIRKVDSRRELAWAEGRLIFENDKVERVIEEFNRYNRVQLRVVDGVLANRQVSGVFAASDPESFIAFLQTVASVQVVRRGDEEISISLKHQQ